MAESPQVIQPDHQSGIGDAHLPGHLAEDRLFPGAEDPFPIDRQAFPRRMPLQLLPDQEAGHQQGGGQGVGLPLGDREALLQLPDVIDSLSVMGAVEPGRVAASHPVCQHMVRLMGQGKAATQFFPVGGAGYPGQLF